MSLHDSIRSGLEALDAKLADLTTEPGDAETALVIALAELDVCREELRVAAEELAEVQRPPVGSGAEWLPVAVLHTDAAGVVREANPAAGRLMRLPWARLTGKPLAAFLETDDRRLLRSETARIVAQGGETQLRVRVTPRGGTPVEVLLHGGPAGPAGPAAGPAHGHLRVVAGGAVPLDAAPVEAALVPAARVAWILLPAPATPRVDGDPWAALAAAAQMIRLGAGGPPDGEHVRGLLETVRHGVPGCLGVALVLPEPGHHGAPHYRAVATAGDGIRLAARQLALGRGPLVDAARTGGARTSEDLRSDDRWPGVGEGSVAAFPFVLDEDRRAAVALFAGPYRLGEDALWAAELLAEVLSGLLRWESRTERLVQESRSLVDALHSRPAIDTAKGIIMARRGCSADEAFQVLVQVSQTTHVKVRDLAAHLVDAVARGEDGFAVPVPGPKAGHSRRSVPQPSPAVTNRPRP